MTNAEAAEVEFSSDYKNAHALMEKAIYCFKQAESEEYEEKARIQSESFEFRRKLFDADRLGTSRGVSPQDYENEKEATKVSERPWNFFRVRKSLKTRSTLVLAPTWDFQSTV